MDTEEECERELRGEIEFYKAKLQEKLEENQKLKVELEYEVNQNWFVFRDEKKKIEGRNRELRAKLAALQETFQFQSDLMHEKNTVSAQYFEFKRKDIENSQRQVCSLASPEHGR